MKEFIKRITLVALRLKNLEAAWPGKIKAFFLLFYLNIKKHRKTQPGQLIKVNFLNYKINALSYFSLEYLLNEIFIKKEYFFVTKSATPVIFDCGSNIGIAIMYFKKLYPNAHIQAFEPNPEVFKVLTQNMAENNIDVVLNNYALCNSNKSVSFYVDDTRGTLKGSILKERGGANRVDIEGRRLSSFLSQYEKIDLIKIDVEGAETEIINDLYKHNMLWLADNYIVEFHHNIHDRKTYLPEFLGKFEEAGFGYSIRTGFRELGGFQDIWIHFYKL
ncbi:MAG: FkbM family methyltransferase [Mucilaginibacter sp.]